MEEKKPKHTPAPGIPEAIHPQIGNGVAWEKNMHAFLLRNPDASKQFERRILPDEIILIEIKSPLQSEVNIDSPIAESAETSIIASIAAGQPDNPSVALENTSLEDGLESSVKDSSVVPDQKEILKPKRKKKPSKDEKPIQVSDSLSKAPKLEKPQKAGKLIKKAAKTVKRQEAEKNLTESPAIILREITLSPYTNWLKSLAGSEYVHPYDEDYAFNQGVGPSSGGISETFADLLAAQGHKDQAIEMYIRLMEKYPEKSSFFAAKIEALQQQ